MSDTPTPWAVLCPEHGRLFLTEEEYIRQLGNASEQWECPSCRRAAEFDDAHWERCMEMEP